MSHNDHEGLDARNFGQPASPLQLARLEAGADFLAGTTPCEFKQRYIFQSNQFEGLVCIEASGLENSAEMDEVEVKICWPSIHDEIMSFGLTPEGELYNPNLPEEDDLETFNGLTTRLLTRLDGGLIKALVEYSQLIVVEQGNVATGNSTESLYTLLRELALNSDRAALMYQEYSDDMANGDSLLVTTYRYEDTPGKTVDADLAAETPRVLIFYSDNLNKMHYSYELRQDGTRVLRVQDGNGTTPKSETSAEFDYEHDERMVQEGRFTPIKEEVELLIVQVEKVLDAPEPAKSIDEELADLLAEES